MSLIYLILILLVISNIFFISLLIKKGKFEDFKYLIQKKVELKNEKDFIAPKELVEHQKEEIKLLKYFIELCEKHDIKYIATAGTLLGAIRHKGFIPWDDDIDLALPKESIHKLKNLTEEMKKDNIYIDFEPRKRNLFKTDLTINQLHYIDNSMNKKDIWIDLFEFEFKDNLYYHKTKFQQEKCPKEIFLKEEFEETIDVPFENIKIKVPKNPYKLLRRMFGDWENLIYDGLHQFKDKEVGMK